MRHSKECAIYIDTLVNIVRFREYTATMILICKESHVFKVAQCAATMFSLSLSSKSS
jgi:hypothetical protein